MQEFDDPKKEFEDFKDFDEEDELGVEIPDIDESLVEKQDDEDVVDECQLEQSTTNVDANLDDTSDDDFAKQAMLDSEMEFDKSPEELLQELLKREQMEDSENTSQSEHKKYVVHIEEKFQNAIDSMTQDEKTEFFNQAIEMKLEYDNKKRRLVKRLKTCVHFLILFSVILLLMPVMIKVANKSIEATFENYRYSERNFEKLFQQRLERGKAYKKTLLYNKMH